MKMSWAYLLSALIACAVIGCGTKNGEPPDTGIPQQGEQPLREEERKLEQELQKAEQEEKALKEQADQEQPQ